MRMTPMARFGTSIVLRIGTEHDIARPPPESGSIFCILHGEQETLYSAPLGQLERSKPQVKFPGTAHSRCNPFLSLLPRYRNETMGVPPMVLPSPPVIRDPAKACRPVPT